MKEKYVQSAILDWLKARGILAFRMNVGAMKIDDRFMRFGVPGIADILAFVDRHEANMLFSQPVWIECKASRGKQSDLQKSFQEKVEDNGHTYILAKDLDDVIRNIR